MKKIYVITLLGFLFANVQGQDFEKDLASAKTSYASGDLSNARFAMEQMLADLDIAIGKEIQKVLPTTMGKLTSDPKADRVNGGSGAGTGLFVHREYGLDPKNANLDIMNNSPMIASLNAVLNTPLIGGMMRNENQKIIKVQGYKSILTKSQSGDVLNYEIQIPMSNTLITFRLDSTDENEITQLASTIPLAKIAQLAQ